MRAFFPWKLLCIVTFGSLWAGCHPRGDLQSCRKDIDCGDPALVCHTRADSDGVCAPPCVADRDQSCAAVAPNTVCFLDARCAPESLSCWADFECGTDGAYCLPDGDTDGVCVREDLALPQDRSYSLRNILWVPR